MEYYTYAYLREDGSPYYIGKGKDNRAYRRHHKVCIPPKNRIIILKTNLTEEESFRHEIYMIAVFGRKDLGTGILHNRTNGGEGSSGRKLPEEQKNKIGNTNRGKTRSEEQKRKLSELSKGENNSFYGKKHSKETKEKMSKNHANVSGENNPFKGKSHSPEAKEKMKLAWIKRKEQKVN